MPKLVRLYIVNVAIGFGLACVFTALLIGFDVAHLRHLVMATQGGWIGALVLVMLNTIVFGGVQFAIAVMRLAEPEDRPRGGRRIRVTGAPVRVQAAAKAPRR